MMRLSGRHLPWKHPPVERDEHMNTELTSRITKELKHVHVGIGHVGRDLRRTYIALEEP